jgi:hypothetical protein
MTKDLTLIALGIFIALLSFLGLPSSWDTILLVLCGLAVSLLTFLLRRDFFMYVERLRRRQRDRNADTYVENDIHEKAPESEGRRKVYVAGVE